MSAVDGESRRRQNRWGEGELLREEIVAAARRLLERDGTEAAVTLRGVAREAGITAPSIYPHFRDREKLIEAVISAVADELTAALNAAYEAVGVDASPRDRLRARCHMYIDFGHQHPASYQIFWTRPHPTAMPQVRETVLNDHYEFLATIAAVAPQLTTEQVRITGILMWTALHGLASLPPHHPRFPWPDQALLVENLLDLHLGTQDQVPGASPTASAPTSRSRRTRGGGDPS